MIWRVPTISCRRHAAEVACVFRDDDGVLRDAPSEHNVIRLAAPADMQRVNRVMPSSLIEAQGQLR
jgi:hypothetical protein